MPEPRTAGARERIEDGVRYAEECMAATALLNVHDVRDVLARLDNAERELRRSPVMCEALTPEERRALHERWVDATGTGFYSMGDFYASRSEHAEDDVRRLLAALAQAERERDRLGGMAGVAVPALRIIVRREQQAHPCRVKPDGCGDCVECIAILALNDMGVPAYPLAAAPPPEEESRRE